MVSQLRDPLVNDLCELFEFEVAFNDSFHSSWCEHNLLNNKKIRKFFLIEIIFVQPIC